MNIRSIAAARDGARNQPNDRQRIFSAQDIYERVWGEPYLYSSGNTIMVHIRNLRRKLEDDSQNPQIIRNVWGKGYRIE